MSTQIDEYNSRNEALLSGGRRAEAERISVGSSVIFNCSKYDYLKGNDGVEDIRNLLVTPTDTPTPEVPTE